jgi:hypothetical protein
MRLVEEDRLQQIQYLLKGRGVLLLALCIIGLAGCRSRFVEVTIVNQGPAMHVMEFDYPNASFGANLLATGAKFSYRFKVQGTGPLSLRWEDASGSNHSADFSRVELGDQGSMLVKIDAGGAVTWTPALTNPK